MTLRIERTSIGVRTVLRLSGRIASEHLVQLEAEIDPAGEAVLLDLEHVTLVDMEGVRFLSDCEARGIELVNCPPYIRAWIVRERDR